MEESGGWMAWAVNTADTGTENDPQSYSSHRRFCGPLMKNAVHHSRPNSVTFAVIMHSDFIELKK